MSQNLNESEDGIKIAKAAHKMMENIFTLEIRICYVSHISFLIRPLQSYLRSESFSIRFPNTYKVICGRRRQQKKRKPRRRVKRRMQRRNTGKPILISQLSSFLPSLVSCCCPKFIFTPFFFHIPCKSCFTSQSLVFPWKTYNYSVLFHPANVASLLPLLLKLTNHSKNQIKIVFT